MHLLIQMLPQHFPKAIHNPLHLLHPQFPLSTPALLNITFQLLQPRMYQLMLTEELELFLERRHLLREDGEDVFLFDGVVEGELLAEFVGGAEEGAEGHAVGAFVGCGGGVEGVPGLAEVVVLGGSC